MREKWKHLLGAGLVVIWREGAGDTQTTSLSFLPWWGSSDVDSRKAACSLGRNRVLPTLSSPIIQDLLRSPSSLDPV